MLKRLLEDLRSVERYATSGFERLVISFEVANCLTTGLAYGALPLDSMAERGANHAPLQLRREVIGESLSRI